MNRPPLRSFCLFVTSLSIVCCSAVSLPAAFVISLDDLSTPGIDVIVADDAPIGTLTAHGLTTVADTAIGGGIVGFAGGVGSFSANVTTGLSQPIIGGSTVARLDLSSVNVSGGLGTLNILLTDTDYLLDGQPGSADFSSSIGGVTDGEVTYTAYLDTSNVEFGDGTTNGTQGDLGPGAFADQVDSTVELEAAPFSLTQQVRIDHAGCNEITSFNAIVDVVVDATPEPSTAIVWSLLVFGAIAKPPSRSRRRSR